MSTGRCHSERNRFSLDSILSFWNEQTIVEVYELFTNFSTYCQPITVSVSPLVLLTEIYETETSIYVLVSNQITRQNSTFVPSSTLYIPRYNRGKEGSSGLTRCLPIDCVKLYKATGAFVSYSGNILYSIYSTLLILSKVF